MRNKVLLLLYLVIVLGFFLRVFGVNWDGGYHMHPDERAITLSVVDLEYPQSFNEFISPESPWNPKFFAYGNFPFYLLRVAGDISGTIDIRLSEYDQINILGRFISALFDTATIVLIFLIGRNLKNSTIGLVAAFIYSVSVLPIQLSHFYAVDTILTFFITFILFLLLKLYDKPSIRLSILIGLFLGLSLATKISATVIIASIFITLSLDFILLFLKSPHRPKNWAHHFPKQIKNLLLYMGIILILGAITFFIVQPYALFDHETFKKQVVEQSHMTKDAFTFPYTLQYVGKIPYLYELKNIILFGQGPIIGVLSLVSFLYVLYRVVFESKNFPWQKALILLQFFLTYFLITGSFAIGFMRYMLPVYPVLSIFVGIFLVGVFTPISRTKIFLGIILLIAILTWPLSFLSIYVKDNTRVSASEWIHKNIPSGSTIATEHWDDVLPLRGQEKYTILSLPLYEPDTMEKWTLVNDQLSKSDYIIVASNRLYVPLMKLTNCLELPSGRCYVKTALYYKELFTEKSGFKKVAEITSYPTIPFTNFQIKDNIADESFTVYDHPKILIFKKTSEE